MPSFNEALNLPRCLSAFRESLAVLAIPDWEIVVVDDGSKDDTAEVLAPFLAADPRIRCVRHPRNKGYGEALLSGIRDARGDWTFITDSDLQFYPEDLAKLLPFVEVADFIQGYRIDRSDPLIRIVMGKVYRTLVHFLFHLPVRDPECSFRLVRTEFLKRLELMSRGAIVPLELVYKASLRGARFREIGIRHRRREEGKSNAVTLKSFTKLLREMWRLYRWTRTQPRS